MKIFFNGNNKAHMEALEQCKVKNVMLSFKYSYANITKFRNIFDEIFVVAGTKTEPDRYHELLKKHKENYDYATQFDVYYNMDETLKHYKKEKDMGIDWTLPVLQENYLHHLSKLRLEPNSYVCLGEVHGRAETEDQIRKLPANLKFHGLAKGRYITQTRQFESLDTSGWISAAMSKKCEIWNNNSTTVMYFGEKGKGMIPMLNHACEIHKEFLEIIGVKKEDILDGEYYALLKAPFALNYMPLCKQYGILEDNFNL
tara:strand:- start:20806 stop:21576 length:771 start_codon:yes stop_codon:yes gene_type:complete